MEKIRILGGEALEDTVRISGAKNALRHREERETGRPFLSLGGLDSHTADA